MEMLCKQNLFVYLTFYFYYFFLSIPRMKMKFAQHFIFPLPFLFIFSFFLIFYINSSVEQSENEEIKYDGDLMSDMLSDIEGGFSQCFFLFHCCQVMIKLFSVIFFRQWLVVLIN